jgi:hypothetical protein
LENIIFSNISKDSSFSCTTLLFFEKISIFKNNITLVPKHCYGGGAMVLLITEKSH